MAAGPAGLLTGGQDVEGDGLGVAVLAGGALGALDTDLVAQACAVGGYVEVCRRALTGPVTLVAVVGLYLFAGVGYDGVLARMWTTLGQVWPPLTQRRRVFAQAFAQARARLGAGPLAAAFTAHAGAGWARLLTRVRRGAAGAQVGLLFGLVGVAVDGTVLDAAATEDIQAVYPRPSGGLYPQVRLVTLVHTATRRIIAATVEAITTSEQVLWDRLVAAGHLTPGMLIMADRNFFGFTRWVGAAATGADLAWRVKNGHASLPARHLSTLADGSHLVALHELDAAYRARRTVSEDRRLPRAKPVTARLVEFTVTSREDRGKVTTSRFRVLTTLLDIHAAPAEDVAAAYAHRWAIEVTYKILKSTVRGAPTRLRAQHPQTVLQEVWALLLAFNVLVEHAENIAADLGLNVAEISITVVLRALRDHLAAGVCEHCGLAPSLDRLLAAIADAPTLPAGRKRTAPRGAPTERRNSHTRAVTHTITIEPTSLPPAETDR